MRLKQVRYKLQRESFDSQSQAGRHNPALVVKFDGRRHVLPVGNSDDWDVYRIIGDTSDRVFCVSWNRHLDYCGVQAYDRGSEEAHSEMGLFLQGEQVQEDVGDLDKLVDRTIARRLIELLEQVSY